MILDIFVSFFLVWSMFSGLTSGLILSATSFIGLIVSGVVTARYLDDFYTFMVSFVKVNNFPLDVNHNYYVYISSYVVMMFSIYVLIYIFARLLKALFGALMLDWVDRIFGAIFGLIKGLIVSIFLLSVLLFAGKHIKSVEVITNNSKAVEMLPEISNLILDLLPEDIRGSIERYTVQ